MPLKGGGRNCAVVDCHNNQRKLQRWREELCSVHGLPGADCPYMEPFRFFCFPTNEELRKEWIKAINRKGFVPNASSVVCSAHFIGGQRTARNPTPVLDLGYKKKVVPGRRILKRKLSSVNLTSAKKMVLSRAPLSTVSDTFEMHDSASVFNGETFDVSVHKTTQTCSSVETANASTQTYVELQDHNYYSLCDKKKQNPSVGIQVQMSVKSNICSDKECIFFTGVSLSLFMALVQLFKLVAPKNFKLDIEDQILLVLMRLRLGLLIEDLARRFSISQSLVSDLIRSWVPVMARKLMNLIIWLPRETIASTMPISFQKLFPKTTCVLDCSEIYVQRPFNLKARGRTWSNYKSHNTAKLLIAIAPNGYIMFLSHLYGGRASDKYITLDCGIMNCFLPGDEVMVDKGFLIEEDLAALKVTMNVPPFLGKRNRLSAEEVARGRRISSVRIHVERAISRLKSFRILKNVFPVLLMDLADDIITICAALCNLKPALIKELDED